MITEQDWTRLESDWHENGTTVRLVYPQSPHEIFIAVRHPDGARMLTVSAQRPGILPTPCVVSANFRAPAAWRCSSAAARPATAQLRVVLTDSSLREVFNPLASDIAATVHAEP